MEEKKKEIRYLTNPFLKETAEESMRGYRRQYTNPNKNACLIIDPEDGDIKPAGFYMKKEIERNEFVKLYARGAAAMLNLSNAGQKVFYLVYNELYGKGGKDKTEIQLAYEMLTETEKELFKRATFYKGIKELVQARFLAMSKLKGYYFINPSYIYNGDRIALVNEYILKKSPAGHVKQLNTQTIDAEKGE